MYALEYAEDQPGALPTLRIGNENRSVCILQTLLGQVGHPVVADCIFGPKTLQAVKDFQQDVDLTQDGIVDADTWEALRSVALRSTTAPGTKTTTPGAKTPTSTGQWVGIGIVGAAMILGALTLWPRPAPTSRRR